MATCSDSSSRELIPSDLCLLLLSCLVCPAQVGHTYAYLQAISINKVSINVFSFYSFKFYNSSFYLALSSLSQHRQSTCRINSKFTFRINSKPTLHLSCLMPHRYSRSMTQLGNGPTSELKPVLTEKNNAGALWEEQTGDKKFHAGRS